MLTGVGKIKKFSGEKKVFWLVMMEMEYLAYS